MSLALKKKSSLPALVSDWLSPVSSLWDRDFFNTDLDLFPRRVGVNVPSVNIAETPKDYQLEVAAPGLERKDFKIEVENHTLSISAEKEEKKKEENDGYSRKEYSFNSFCRSFTLPENIKEDEIDAKYKDGILKVTVPKAKETPAKPVHSIPVS